MRVWIRYGGFLILGLVLSLTVCSATSRNTVPSETKRHQIVVQVYPTSKGLGFEVEAGKYKNYEYKKRDANYLLAELKLHEGGDCQIIELVDDRAPLSAITEASEMAINAGFKDIRPFVYWHQTGRMAQVQFGPPIKATANPDEIETRIEKAH